VGLLRCPRDKCNRCDTPKPPGAGGGGGGGRGGGRVQAAPQGPAGNVHSRLLFVTDHYVVSEHAKTDLLYAAHFAPSSQTQAINVTCCVLLLQAL